MRTALRLVAVLPALLSLTSCASMRHADTNSDMATIFEHEAEWLRAFERRDYDWIALRHLPDGRLLPPNAPPAIGREAVHAAWVALRELPGMKASWSSKEAVISESGDMAYSTGAYTLAFDGPEGRVEDHGKFLEVWRKVDGEWLVAVDMFSSDLPPAPAQ